MPYKAFKDLYKARPYKAHEALYKALIFRALHGSKGPYKALRGLVRPAIEEGDDGR